MKTLSQLVSGFFDRFMEASTNSRYTPTKVREWINEGYIKTLELLGLDDTRRTVVMQNYFSTVSDEGTSVGTTLYTVSAGGLQPGQQIFVFDEANTERVVVSSISGNTVSLVSPGLSNTYAEGSSISSNQLWTPSNFARMETITISGGELSESKVLISDTLQIHEIRSGGNSVIGDPTGYMPGAVDMTRLPSSGNYTCGLYTLTGSVDCSSLPAVENLFTGWLFINTTRNAAARVQSYNYLTKVLTLDSTISGQVPNDGFILEKRLNSIYLNKIPDDVYTITISYLANTSYMQNDYDVPIFREAYHDILINYALSQAYLASPFGDKSLGFEYEKKFWAEAAKMKEKLEVPEDGTLRFRSAEEILTEQDLTFWG